MLQKLGPKKWVIFLALLIFIGLPVSVRFAPVSRRLATSGSAAPYNPEEGTVELHSHLFMDEGMGFMFHGKFNGPLEATSWKDRFRSMANPETVEQSNIAILVVALYALPVMNFSMKDSIRRQIADAEQFVQNHPDWIIAKNPDEAAQALQIGKRVLVLSLESAWGVLDSEDDIKEFVDQRGIRIVTFMHLMDNQLGGAAYLHGYHALSDFFSWLFGSFSPHEDDGVRVNPRGLEPKGREILKKLLAHHVWIDLSHADDATVKEMIPVILEAGQPLLYTHAPLRKYYGSERGLTEEQLALVRQSGGIVGVVPSEDMLVGTQVDPSHCGTGCPVPCQGGAPALAQQYSEVAAALGSADHVMLGSDYNGGIPHLHPACGTQTSLDTEGLWNIGQASEVWKSLKALGAPVPASPEGSREVFLQDWARAYEGK